MFLNDFKEKLSNIKLALFDLDGTIYLGDELISGTKTALKSFRDSGIQIVYLTNNSSKTTNEYQSKLMRLGVFEKGDIIYTSLMATADYLLQNHKGDSVYLFGTKASKEYFESVGINLSDRADIAVLAYNTELTYKDICTMNENLYNGAKYIATHLDVLCPAKGVFLPDNGAICEIFNKSVNRYPQVVIGKPEIIMGDMIKQRYNLSSSQILMVGDRLYTDIKFGLNCGFLTSLVLSGETKKSQAKTDQGYYIFDSVAEISKFL